MTGSKTALTASVVVITMSRPDFLRTCLQHLAAQTVGPWQTIVVDASPDDLTRRLVAEEFPEVCYVHNPLGPGTMGVSRNMGLGVATGDILAFVDDDAFAANDWLEQLLRPYADPGIGGVGGRARNGIAGEESFRVDDIGRFHEDGTLSGNFGADPGRVIEVDHLLGANMSFRRQAVVDVGGIRAGYPGTCLREETDMAFRIRAAGWQLAYNPDSSVRHVAAPYKRGRRFDVRYEYFANRNHMVLLVRHFGFRDPRLRRYSAVLGRTLRHDLRASFRPAAGGPAGGKGVVHTVGRAVVRSSAAASGLVVGLGAGYFQRRADRRH